MLSILGSGATWDFLNNDLPPWDSFKNEICKVIIGGNVTHIGNNAFANCSLFSAVEIESVHLRSMMLCSHQLI